MPAPIASAAADPLRLEGRQIDRGAPRSIAAQLVRQAPVPARQVAQQQAPHAAAPLLIALFVVFAARAHVPVPAPSPAEPLSTACVACPGQAGWRQGPALLRCAAHSHAQETASPTMPHTPAKHGGISLLVRKEQQVVQGSVLRRRRLALGCRT